MDLNKYRRVFVFSLMLCCTVFIHCSKNEEAAKPEPENDYPVIAEFAKAGVTNGIPGNSNIINTLNPGDNIQNAINAATQTGGVILLNEGTYTISSTLYLKDNIILRGTDRNKVVLESTIRSTSSQGKKNTIEFNNTSYAGLEKLTVIYKVEDTEPIDRGNWLDGGWCGECFGNNPHGVDNLYVRLIAINNNSNNCWVDQCNLLKSGTDPVLVAGSHNTLQNNLIDQAYNKGGGGNGYYDLRGSYNLIKGDTVKRIRHFAVQQGAEYNVVYDCFFEVDVNFHNKDKGNNLVEKNTIHLPSWHGWDIFATGGAEYGHTPPGPKNIILNNTTNYKNQGARYANPNVIYTFNGYGAPVATDWELPENNSFYKP